MTFTMAWKGVEVLPTRHTLKVLDAENGQSLPVSSRFVRTLPHPDRTANVWAVKYTPWGDLFAAGYPSGVVQLFDPVTGTEKRRIESPRGYRGSAEYTTTPDDFSIVWVPLDGRKVVEFRKDGKKTYRVEYNGMVRRWDLRTGKELPEHKVTSQRGAVTARVSPDGTRLVVGERKGYLAGERSPPDEVWLYDTANAKSWKLGEGYVQATFSPDSKQIYAAVSRYDLTPVVGELKVFDRDGKESESFAKVEGETFGIPILSPEGKHLLVQVSKGTINEPGTLRLYDRVTRKELGRLSSGGNYPFRFQAFTPDGKRVIAADFKGKLLLWEVASRTVVRTHTIKERDFLWNIAFSPDGRYLAVPARVPTKDEDNSRDPDPLDLPQPRVYLFDLSKDAEPEEIICPHGWNGGLAFSPDSKTLAVGGAGGVHLFALERPGR